MLQNTFLFLPGISVGTEQALWKQGITTWTHFLQAKELPGLGTERKAHSDRLIKEARHAVEEGNSTFFLDKLPLKEHWRLFKHFDCLYVDIEVSHVTKDLLVISCYDGVTTKVMIKDFFDLQALKDLFQQTQLFVTYNGATFDLPFLRKRFPSIPQKPCFDLRTGCQRLGLQGGLKSIEQQLGITRENRLQGGDPAQLYRMWKGSGDEHYLQLLLHYNEEDVVHLQPLAQYVYAGLERTCSRLIKLK